MSLCRKGSRKKGRVAPAPEGGSEKLFFPYQRIDKDGGRSDYPWRRVTLDKQDNELSVFPNLHLIKEPLCFLKGC